MTVTFAANFMNHHQLQFSSEMQRLTDGGYTFVASSPIYSEQKALGYEDMNMLPFVIRTYDGDSEYQKAIAKIRNDDIVIFGSCPNEWIELRKSTGKPFLIYSERFFKKGTWRRFIPITYKKIYNRMLKFQSENMAVICSSAYLPYDLNLLRANIKTYKWGYFPEVKTFNDVDNLIKEKKKNSLLWVGRFVKLKHIEDAIYVAEKLKSQGYDFEFNIIGRGPLEENIRNSITKKGLSNFVHLLGSMSPEEVRRNMEKSEIFMFTSDFHEGWGAVMNESMNSACAVVASHAAGSVPYLINDGQNGFVYASKNKKQLFEKVKFLIDNPEKRCEISKNAYHTMTDKWNATVATERLYNIISAIVGGKDVPLYLDGPCSEAKNLKPTYKEQFNDKK